MQQKQKTIFEKCFIGLMGTAWTTGLLIAGSDSPYMPWLNGIGLLLFFSASILLGKLFKPSNSNADIVIYPKFYQKFDINAIKSKKKNQRIHTGYAKAFF
ncbi:MAG: hypothetical protein KAJ25_03230 [Desulfobacula sp.]|nr:hypothetical protein [Desulfobacula sp.]MCK5162937.1 hypothetical protein [Desulfobacula sp.]MCK5348372.1 hypothetical protein [Desulfobacula sp.]